MKKLFILSKENLNLAKEEILSLLKTKGVCIDNLLVVEDNSDIKVETRLGYTHSIYSYLFQCKKKDLINKIISFNWNKVYNKSLCVRAHSCEYDEREIANLIYAKIKNPKVNLRNPHTKIEFFFRGDYVVCGLFQIQLDKSYLKRKAHLRPAFHPTSLDPRLARACINLTGLARGIILDPFCGSGGILIEAGLMGFKVIGIDIDINQITRAKKNLEYYNVNCILEKGDAGKITTKADAIVTDLPYGKGSKAGNLNELYLDFLNNAANLTDLIIVIFPDFIDYKLIVKQTQWHIVNEFSIYIHKSLTRKIIKLMKVPSH